MAQPESVRCLETWPAAAHALRKHQAGAETGANLAGERTEREKEGVARYISCQHEAGYMGCRLDERHKGHPSNPKNTERRRKVGNIRFNLGRD